ncbi:MAG: caspase family protein [Burkholderiaceae bacterium]
MFQNLARCALAFAIVFLAPLAYSQPAPESRLALLIGNSSYRASPLRNPVNDVRLMEQALKQAGFRVFRAENANRREMQRMVRDFGELLKKEGGVGLFYFSGHGMQIKGSNYLVPVDSDLQSEDEVPFDSLDAQIVLEKMEGAGNRMNMLILDACRSNPFPASSRSAARGLAQMNAPSGTIVAYATSPGNVALDGTGSNSPYTQHLARAILQPGVPVEEIFKQVRTAVRRDTNNSQTPWENTALEGQFFFRPPSGGMVPAVAPAQGPQGGDMLAVEMAYWDTIKDSARPAELQAYLTQFPEGRFAPLVRARLMAQPDPARPPQAAIAPEGVMLHGRDELAGIRQRLGRMVLNDPRYGEARATDVSLVAGPADRRTYSTGDVIANDGRVTAVRMGEVVMTVREGALWTIPLKPGTRGHATVATPGQASVGSVDWEVASASGVTAKINYFVAGGGTTASHSVDQNRRYGTWSGTFTEGLPFASSFRMQTFNGGYARSMSEVVTGEMQRLTQR